MRPQRYTLWTVLLCALLSTTAALGEKLPLNAEAQRHFEAGLAYADDPGGPKWEEALKQFQLAYQATPTPKLMNNIGVCALNLERDGEAIEAYKAYLAGGAESDLKPKQRKQIETDIATLSASLVKISLKSVPDEITIVDRRENAKGQVIRNVYQVKGGIGSLGLHPGLHRITAEANGYVSQEWVVDAAPASSHEHTFELEPVAKPKTEESGNVQTSPPPPSKTPAAERKTPTSVYIGLAATGVFAGAATAAGIIALGKSKDLDKVTVSSQVGDKQDQVKQWALITDIGIGAAVVSAGVTAYLYFSAPKVSKEQPLTVSRWQLAPVVTPTVAGGAFLGTF